MSFAQDKKTTGDADRTAQRIVVVTPSFLPAIGGVETHVLETVTDLLEQGYSVEVFSAGKEDQTQEITLKHHIVQVTTVVFPRIPIVGLLVVWFKLLAKLSTFSQASIIHVHDVMIWLLPIRLLLPFSRIVLTMHGWEGKYPIPTKLKFLKQFSAICADRLLLVGEFISKYYQVIGDAITYGAVNQQQLSQVAAMPNSRLTVAYAGRLAPDTGFIAVLSAARARHDIRWQFYGDGELRDQADLVGEVMGWSAQRKWLQTADIVIASGYLSVWECLAAGKLVVAVADNQLKQDYFHLAPFAANVVIVANADELEKTLRLLSQLSKVELQERILHGIELAKQYTWGGISVNYANWYQELASEPLVQRFKKRLSHIRWSYHHLALLLAGILATYFGVLAISLGVMLLAGSQIKGDFATFNSRELQRHVKTGLVASKVANILTFQKVSLIRSLKSGFLLVADGGFAYDSVTKLAAEPDKPQHDTYQQLSSSLTQILTQVGEIDQELCGQHSGLFFSSEIKDFCAVTSEVKNNWSQLSQLASYWFGGERKLLVLLQNTQELRATGGFMGSYAMVDFSGQTLPTYAIGDIYEPDGQFKGFVNAPAGVDEFLSSGKGMRLPDANWQPDFPTSAQTILQYFAFGNKRGLDGVIAINMSLMEEILKVIGPVYLPDYKIQVTAANLADVARADRQHFFPGSVQKQHFLQTLTNQVKLAALNLNRKQQLSLIQILFSGLKRREIQVYQVEGQQQQIIDDLGWSGRQSAILNASLGLDTTVINNQQEQPLYLMLIESNVGINKANRSIQRSVLADVKPEQLLVQIRIKNNNMSAENVSSEEAVNGMGYVNYQRLYVSKDVGVQSIEIEGKKLSTWHEQLITTEAGEVFNQIGFVFPVPQGQEKTALVSLVVLPAVDAKNTVPIDLTKKRMIIQRQSGLPDSTYILQTPTAVKQWQLTQDISLDL